MKMGRSASWLRLCRGDTEVIPADGCCTQTRQVMALDFVRLSKKAAHLFNQRAGLKRAPRVMAPRRFATVT